MSATSQKNNKKAIKNREKVFKTILFAGEIDFTTLQIKADKEFGLSGTKVRTAVEELVKAGRIVQNGKKYSGAPTSTRIGTYFCSGNKSYVVFDGDSRQYEVTRKFAEDATSGKKVVVGFSYREDNTPLPFIVGSASAAKSGATSALSFMETGDPSLVYGKVMKTSHDELVFIPYDTAKYKDNILILNEKKTLAQFQDKVCTLRIVPPHKNDTQPMGYIEKVHGDASNPFVEFDAIAQMHGAFRNFNTPEIKKFMDSQELTVDRNKYNFIDENGKLIINNGSNDTLVLVDGVQITTIDPPDCKDMDDGICASHFDKNGNLVYYVAVANVTRYIPFGSEMFMEYLKESLLQNKQPHASRSEIFMEYLKGAFTLYLPNKAYNILPPLFSTNLSSLNPNEDKLAFVAKHTINPKTGEVIDTQFMDALIVSKEKFSYEKAQKIIDENPQITIDYIRNKWINGEELNITEQVLANYYAGEIINKQLDSRNRLNFNNDREYRFNFNKSMDRVESIVKVEDVATHKTISGPMIITNEATAKFAKENNIPIIYRVHDEPNESKLEKAFEFFGFLDIPFDGDLTVNGLNNILASVKGTEKEAQVNEFLVQLQSKAKYSVTTNPKDVEFVSDKGPKKGGKGSQSGKKTKLPKAKTQAVKDFLDQLETAEISHFGLQSEAYSHTTSPIRRVTDYFTIYNILAYQAGREMIPVEYLREVAMWANQRQDEIDEAERQGREVAYADYAQQHINEKMTGRIVSFKFMSEGKHNGIQDLMAVVENPDTGMRVHIPAIEIVGDKVNGNSNLQLSQYGSAIVNGENNKPVIIVCDTVTFKIAEANKATRMIYASTNMQLDFTKESFQERLVALQEQFAPTQRPTGYGRIVANTEYKHRQQAEEIRNEELVVERGKKGVKQFKNTDLVGDITPEEAEENRRHHSKQVRSHRQALKYEYEAEDYDIDEILNNAPTSDDGGMGDDD